MITVKPLIWTQYKWQIFKGGCMQTALGYSNDQNYRVIEQSENGEFEVLRVSVLNDDGVLFKSKSLGKCQAWVRESWNKYVLSLIEVK